jgi:hypothetical protein
MMTTVLVSVVAFAILMGLMALGVMLNGKRLSGSCGGNPDSANCECSPQKRQQCREKHSPGQPERDVFSGPLLTEESLAPPGERRLVQLRTGRR